MVGEPQVFSVRARCKSFRYALQGIGFTLRSQHNAWLHLLAATLVCLSGWLLGVSAADWRWLIVLIALVWFAELMNTAFEFLCDVVAPEYHPAVKRAKDIAAGAVLICALCAALIGALVFWPYLNVLQN